MKGGLVFSCRSRFAHGVLSITLASCVNPIVDGTSTPSSDTPTDGDTHAATDTEMPATTHTDPTLPVADGKTRVILMIGDGMGRGQRETASLFKTGLTGGLFMESLPHQATVATASLSGVTDSAASATAMATGQATVNLRIGMDREAQPLETLVELAQQLEYAAGVVSTAALPHATPGAFTAHHSTRFGYTEIASDQALEVLPDLMLGGGLRYFLPAGPDSERTDDGLIAPLLEAGCEVVYTADELAATLGTHCLTGLFADDHMTWVNERTKKTTEPTLPEMTRTALERLNQHPNGFFLMVEGAKIDMASHSNELEQTVSEMLDFDEAVRTTVEWAQSHPDTTVLITADHECGGLDVLVPGPAGQLSEVNWRHRDHTNRDITMFGDGPLTELLDEQIVDHRWAHAMVSARLRDVAFEAPAPVLLPDGRLGEHQHHPTFQTRATNYGEGFNQLDALTLDANTHSLAIGIEGVFEWGSNAVVVLIDRDYGADTGITDISSELSDFIGQVDGILYKTPLGGPVAPGFGAELAAVSVGAEETWSEELTDVAGLRGLTPPLGAPDDLWWLPVALNFAESSRTVDDPIPVISGSGLEILIDWVQLYPDLKGNVPPGATVAIAAFLVNNDGELSNQFLPPLPTADPDPTDAVALPAVVQFVVDENGDGIADGTSTPVVVR